MERKTIMYIWSKCTGKGYGYFALKISNSNYALLDDNEKSKLNILKEFSDGKVISVPKPLYHRIMKKITYELKKSLNPTD